jgi:LPXTG-motif cell wall-anchored protein
MVGDISASLSGSASSATGAISTKFAPVTIGQGVGGSTGGGSSSSWLTIAAVGLAVAGVIWFFIRRKKS